MRPARAIAGLAALTTAAWLAACASDEDATFEPRNDDTRVPDVDGGADAEADGDAARITEEPCLPETLCPLGPFEPGTTGGALDLRTRIHRIIGRSANDVWAVGAAGAIAHFDGTKWSRTESGAIESFTALWLRSQGELALAKMAVVYARNAGVDGVDGGAPSAAGWLRTSPVVPSSLTAGVATGAVTSAWAPSDAAWLWGTTVVPEVPSVPTTQNGLWRAKITPETRTLELAPVLPAGACRLMGCLQLLDIHGSSADDLWAVGVRGATFHITDAQSETPSIIGFDSQTWAGLDGVWAATANDAWAVGGNGTIRHYTGGAFAWDVVDGVPTTEDLHAVWGSSSSDIWAVGDAATVLHYDGKAWSRMEVRGLGMRRPDLYTVWSPAPGRVWIGGDGVILSLGGKP